MTSNGPNEQKQHADGGDIAATTDATNLSDQEMAELGGRPGRGAREVAGAEPSDDFVFEHVKGDDAQGPDLPTETRQE